ncbi:MAG: diguanylate cyclase [Chromatiaceae bacterium]|nr:diguanylate cyclase [Gammaproteobacteria bacterium]MCP5305115.1 diguanylate cyclase [Chromatiaceae bacterium]MCP5315074.1 diguanylate cyclase [Chromatiaceae bacterium]
MTQIDQSLLQNAPFGLLLIDRNDLIGWANQRAAEMLQSSVAELTGQRVNALGDASRKLLQAEPKVQHAADQRHWVRRIVESGADDMRLVILQDVTEQERLAEENARLRQQVEDLRLTDDLTGLPNKRAISQALDLHISRSRRYQNPLSIALVQVDMQGFANLQPLSTDPVTLAVSRFLRDRLRWVDQIARWADNVFLLVLPETVSEDAEALLEKIRGEQDSIVVPEAFGDLRPRLAFGLACWAKGDDMRTLLRKALNGLAANAAA